MARTDTLGNFLTDVANAIKEKKGTTDTIPASNFDTEIANLPSGGGKYAPKYILFRDCTETDLTEEISNLDTKNITSMKNMFYSCKNVTSLDLSGWNTSNVTSMESMFYQCSNVKEIDVSNFDMSNVTNIKSMFSNTAVTSLDFSNWDVSNVRGEVTSVFGSCRYLKEALEFNGDTKYMKVLFDDVN